MIHLRARWMLLCLLLTTSFISTTTLANEIDPVLVGAGDIAACNSSGDEATAALLDTIDGTIFTTGDNVYDSGTDAQFANCYEPSWGRHKARTRPSVGNHEYQTAGAAGYFNYFGAAAGDPDKGYYSYDLGAWHVIAINSNCTQVGGCGAGSPQERWLRADLATNPAECTVAYWHHPRYSSGSHGGSTTMQAIWQALYDYGADLVIAGHDHHYERFAPLDGAGNADPNGIRSFIVGSGGKSHYPVGTPLPNSEIHNDNTFGVLKLTLHPTSYDWEFVPEASKSFTDGGSGTCVNRVPPPAIYSLNPASATAGGPAFTLNVDGIGFASDAVLRWNGADRPTTVIDSTRLTAEIAAADIATAGSASVTVFNPPPGGGASNTKSFAINPVPSSNLLKNPGFELDANNDTRPDNWGTNTHATRSNAVVHRGTYSMQHTATNNSSYTLGQTVSNLTPGATYVFGGWVNIPPTTDTFSFRLQARWRNSSNTLIVTHTLETYAAPTGGWVQTTTGLVAPPNAVKAEIRMIVTSLDGTIYVDDMEFRREASTSLTFPAEADAHVQERYPGANYGSITNLRIDGGSDPDIEGYVRFNVSGINQPIQSARVRLYVTNDASANGPAIYATGNDWTEAGITWNTRPARVGGAIDDLGSLGTYRWVEYDVTPLVTGNGTYSFVLATNTTDGVVFSSNQGNYPPRLVLMLGN